MQDIELTAPLTRGREEIAPGTRISLPPTLAGKLLNHGRAKLADRVVHAVSDGGGHDNRE